MMLWQRKGDAASPGGGIVQHQSVTTMRPVLVSTYPPRTCGIAAFTADLRAGLVGVPEIDDVRVAAVVNEPSDARRPEVAATIRQAVRQDYVRAARLIGRSDVDVVLLQHEFGIFGGRDGEYVLSLAEELVQPLVITLHTVLSQPSRGQLRVFSELCEHAAAVIVMTDTAARLVEELGICAADKVRVVPHGAPALLGALAARPPDPGDRFVLSTFGLLSSGKGLETAIEALASVVERHPEACYVISGRTHPEVARREGERYRLELEQRIFDLGLRDHVELDDRFLSLEQVADLLARTDLFVTPYRNREQIASGTLTFAIAAGCAAVSTPYWYAEDLLATGAGRLVPFDDPDALADTICELLEDPEALAAARAEARRIGARLAWPAVAAETASFLRDAIAAAAPRRRALGGAELELGTVRVDHLRTLVDDVGIVQHARGVIPHRKFGYCVDDVARLTMVAGELARRDDHEWTPILHRSLAFLLAAVGDDGSGMRNFMGYDRCWLDEPHVGDHVGRSIWALGEILTTASVPALVTPVRDLLACLVDSLAGEVPIRTAAYALIGLARLDDDRLEPAGAELRRRLVQQLLQAYRTTAAPGWRFFESALAYDNARLPHALIASGAATNDRDCVEVGLESLRWLGDECGVGTSVVRLPGHCGRRRDEPAPGEGDEQPLDACALVEAEIAAFSATGDPEHGERAQAAFTWFLGRNRLGRPLYDFATGGCSDGLGAETVNLNQGAESTLAFHRAWLALDVAGLLATSRRRPVPTRGRPADAVVRPLHVPVPAPRRRSPAEVTRR
jgi:glycosyltransferase involved in cell wall biosynthesis